MKKVTKADILSIKPGEFKVFVFETTKSCYFCKIIRLSDRLHRAS